MAMVQTKGRGGVCSHGRCLLESDGTLDIAAAGNSTQPDLISSSDFNPFANMSNLEYDALANALNGMNNPYLPFNYSTPAINDSSAGSTSILPLNSNPTPSATSYGATAFPSLDSQGPILPDPNSTILNCPCNCTYVSPSCCLTKDVWDDPMGQVQMAPLPANATVFCDETTGAWVPSWDRSDKVNGTRTAFDEMGNVAYSPSPSIPKPTETNGGG